MITKEKILEDFDKKTKEFRNQGYETMTVECARAILSTSIDSLLQGILSEVKDENSNSNIYCNVMRSQGFNSCLSQVKELIKSKIK